jgi:quercetin dioxygenase-like cupin family protein
MIEWRLDLDWNETSNKPGGDDIMSVIHRYTGQFDSAFDWAGVDPSRYPGGKEVQGVTIRWLIGPAEKAPNFALRYLEVEPGGWSALHQHAHDHGVMIIKGQGEVRLGEEVFEVTFGDVVYISPDEVHQIRNTGDEPLGFLCIIPALE